MRQPDLSIIIPAYREAAVIESSLSKLAEWLKGHNYGDVEVLVVVADSPDGTAKLAERCAKDFASLRVVHAGPRVGKGRDVRLGMLEATDRYRLFMDADLATPLVHLDDVWRLMEHDATIAIAVRNLWSIHKQLSRKIITQAGNVLARFVLLSGIKDTQCGFKLFSAEATEAIFPKLTILGWGFDLEVLAIARKLKYPIDFIDTPDWRDPKAHTAGLAGDSTGGAALQVLGDLLRIRWNIIRGRYKS